MAKDKDTVYADKAREGRSKQVYSEKTGARVVAGCVVLNKKRTKVLLISSSAHPKKWVIPKGGVESDELNSQAAAVRETWEEAGVKGTISKSLGTIEDMRPPKNWGSMDSEDPVTGVLTHPPRSEFHLFEMIVEEEFEVYPESDKRRRKWFKYAKAIEKMEESKRPELALGINRSSIKKNIDDENDDDED